MIATASEVTAGPFCAGKKRFVGSNNRQPACRLRRVALPRRSSRNVDPKGFVYRIDIVLSRPDARPHGQPEEDIMATLEKGITPNGMGYRGKT